MCVGGCVGVWIHMWVCGFVGCVWVVRVCRVRRMCGCVGCECV